MPFTCSTPGGQLVPPRDVVARAGRQDLDLAVTREVFGDVPRVQLGAAVDRLAVALDDDRDLHCASGSGTACPEPVEGACPELGVPRVVLGDGRLSALHTGRAPQP